jgi:hypothetical protein
LRGSPSRFSALSSAAPTAARHLSQIWNLLSCQASPIRAPCLHVEVTDASIGVPQ